MPPNVAEPIRFEMNIHDIKHSRLMSGEYGSVITHGLPTMSRYEDESNSQLQC
jgi:hypothetical protein